MAGVGTRQPGSSEEEHDLEEWFARRLEAQGIPVGPRRTPTSRVLAVGGLVIALLGLLWALSGAGSTSPKQAAPAGQPPVSTPPPTSNPPTSQPPKAVSWRNVQVDVLNGYGGSGAAGSVAEQLTAAGWKVASTGDAGSEATKTIVIFAPGFRRQARAVSHKLGTGAPVPIASAAGVPANATAGVAILLGPDLLP